MEPVWEGQLIEQEVDVKVQVSSISIISPAEKGIPANSSSPPTGNSAVLAAANSLALSDVPRQRRPRLSGRRRGLSQHR